MIITATIHIHRRIFSLLCVLLIFIAILPITAFAEWVTISTVNSPSYFLGYNSKSEWHGIGTPAHYVNETGAVAYCIQTNYNSPNNSGYTSTNGWQYYDEVTIRGMQAAKAIAVGSSNITLADLASPELVTDEAFYLIICALLMAKYGDVVLNLENEAMKEVN